MTTPLLVTVYTEGTRYAGDAEELARSARAFGYAVRRVGMPDRGNWWANVAHKPQVFCDVLGGHAGPALFLDADCRVVAPLAGLEPLLEECDVAAAVRPDNCFSARINSGVVLFNATDAAREVARLWAERAARFAPFHRFGDQPALGEALVLAGERVRFRALPQGFNVDAVDGRPPAGCVVSHLKRSRDARSGFEPPAPDGARAGAQRLRAIVLRPDPDRVPGGSYTRGVVARINDTVESVRRYGVGYAGLVAFHRSGSATAHSGDDVLTALDFAFRREDCATPLILAHDAVVLRDPAPLYAALERSEVVLAWNIADRRALPVRGLLGVRAEARVRDALMPRLCAALGKRGGADDGLVQSLAEVLREPPAGVRVAVLAPETVADAGGVTEETVVLRVGEGVRTEEERSEVRGPRSEVRGPRTED